MLPKVYRLKQKCGGVVTGSPICIHAESGIAKRMRERERERERCCGGGQEQAKQPTLRTGIAPQRPLPIKAGRGSIWKKWDLI